MIVLFIDGLIRLVATFSGRMSWLMVLLSNKISSLLPISRDDFKDGNLF